jgi:ATPase subunit of ABC transporter with duplicated ATPase domains
LLLASVLLSRPDMLLLDEPSNDLDIASLEWLEDFILNCDSPILFVSHDETLIENAANVIVHIEQLRKKRVPKITVAKCGYDQYKSQRLAAIEKQSKMSAKEQSEFEKKQERFQKIYNKVEHQQNVISRQDPHGGQLLKKKMKSVKSQEKRYEKEKQQLTQPPDYEDAIFPRFSENVVIPQGKIVLDFHLPLLCAGEKILAANVDLQIKGPEKVCIVGDNGTGKTTLIKEIAKVLLPRTDVNTAYMPQNYMDVLNPDITAAEFLANDTSKDNLTKARTFLGSMKFLPEESDRKIETLSGGQKAKLLFIKLVFGEYNVLILDEPTRNFSPLSCPVIREILKKFGGAVIAVSHDRKFIAGADRLFQIPQN